MCDYTLSNELFVTHLYFMLRSSVMSFPFWLSMQACLSGAVIVQGAMKRETKWKREKGEGNSMITTRVDES